MGVVASPAGCGAETHFLQSSLSTQDQGVNMTPRIAQLQGVQNPSLMLPLANSVLHFRMFSLDGYPKDKALLASFAHALEAAAAESYKEASIVPTCKRTFCVCGQRVKTNLTQCVWPD